MRNDEVALFTNQDGGGCGQGEAVGDAFDTELGSASTVIPGDVDGIGSGVFGGYAYLNLSIQRLASARMPGGKASDADVNYLGVGEPPPYVPDPRERNLRASLAGLRYLWRTLKVTELLALADDQRRVERFLAELPDTARATDQELRETVRDMIPLFDELFERHLVVSLTAGAAVAVLSGLCERQLDDALLASRLLAGLGDVDSAAPSQAMWELSRAPTPP